MDERPEPQRRQAYTDSFSRSEDPLTQLGLPPRTGKTGRLEPTAPPPPGRPLSTQGPADSRRPPTGRLPRTQSLQHLGTGPLAQKIDKALDKGADGLAAVLFGAAQAVVVPFLKAVTYPLILAQQLVMLPLQWFTAAIDAITGMMGGFAQPKPAQPAKAGHQSRRAPATTRLAAPMQEAAAPTTSVDLGFVSLFQQGIRFSTVRNLPLVNPEHMQLQDAEAIVMARAILEIQGCAQLAGELPPPDKGPYANRAIAEVMALVDRREVVAFLAYVAGHPKPFMDRQLKLADAFATWIHKGAPS